MEAKVKEIYQAVRQTYGSRRVVKELEKAGCDVGRYRVTIVMRRLALRGKTLRRYKVTTDSDHRHPVALNRLDRQFEMPTPNQVWTVEMTSVWTLEVWL